MFHARGSRDKICLSHGKIRLLNDVNGSQCEMLKALRIFSEKMENMSNCPNYSRLGRVICSFARCTKRFEKRLRMKGRRRRRRREIKGTEERRTDRWPIRKRKYERKRYSRRDKSAFN